MLGKTRNFFSKWMPLFAFVVSIVVGIVTIADQTIVAQSERKFSDLDKLDDIVIEIGRANATAVALMTGHNNLSAARQMNSIKFPLVASAMNIIERRREAVTADVLLVLAGELIQIQNYEVAHDYATLARKLAQIEDTRIEATRIMAVTAMGKCGKYDCQEAHELFKTALESAKRVDNHNRFWLISNSLRDWAIQAIFFAKCDEASEILGRFASEIPLPIGRAPARLGFHAVLESADFVDICDRKTIESHIDGEYFKELTKNVFSYSDSP